MPQINYKWSLRATGLLSASLRFASIRFFAKCLLNTNVICPLQPRPPVLSPLFFLSFTVSYVPRFVAATIFNGLTADSECTLEIVGASALDPKSHAHTRAAQADATHSLPPLPLSLHSLPLSCSSCLANSAWLLP